MSIFMMVVLETLIDRVNIKKITLKVKVIVGRYSINGDAATVLKKSLLF